MPPRNEEGVIYVAQPGSRYDAQEIDADELAKVAENEYLRAQYRKVLPQIFSGMYRLTVRDHDGEEDEELTMRIKAMVEAPGVDLWSRMRQSWLDVRQWGPCLVYPRWVRSPGSAEVVLRELRRLDPYTFRHPPSERLGQVYSELLPGITLSEDGELELWQTQDALQLEPVRLKRGVLLLKDPMSAGLAGDSDILSLVPILRMLADAWAAQDQKVYRIGSPIMFIKVVNPEQGDREYAQTILRNWGKDTAFQLRENMEFVEMKLHDNETALNTIEKLEEIVRAHFNPASALQKEGSTIGGNAAAEKETADEWIMGERSMIEDLWEGVVQRYLELNGFEGYSIELTIAARVQAPGDLELRQAQLGWQTRTLSPNEVRQRIGAPEIDDEKLAEIAAQWSLVTPSAPMSPWDAPLGEVEQRARVVQTIASADPVDPERYMTFREQRDFLRGAKGS